MVPARSRSSTSDWSHREAIEMGLEVEKVEVKKNKEGEEIHKPVADYVKAADERRRRHRPRWRLHAMIGCRPTASN